VDSFPQPSRSFSRSSALLPSDVLRLVPRVWPLVRPFKQHLIYLFLLALPGVPGGLLALVLIRILFDVVLGANPMTPVQAALLRLPPTASREVILRREFAVLAIALVVLVPLAMLLLGYAVWILQRVTNLFRVNLYARLQEMSISFHSREKIGDAIFRMFQDSASVPSVISGLILAPLSSLPGAIGNVIWLALFDYPMAAIAAVLIPANFIVAASYGKKLREAFRAERETAADATTRIEETLASIKAVKAYGREASEAEIYARDNWTAFLAARRARLLIASYRVWTNSLRALAITAAIYFGAMHLVHGGRTGAANVAETLGLFLGTLWVLGRLSGRTRDLTDTWASLQDVVTAIARVLEIMERPGEETNRGGFIAGPVRRGLSFTNISFSYDPNRSVLSSVEFVARVGEITALVGPSGAGKSTIIALILRLFDPASGAVTVDDRDIRTFDLAAYRAILAVGLQENPIFTASLGDNLTYGCADGGAERIADAVERAGLSDFVESLPAGLDTMLGEKGSKLSTGQAQRIGLARAFLRDAPILVLDEPTSALEPATEAHVMRAIRGWIEERPRDRLALIATHRMTAAAMADCVYRIADGRVEHVALNAQNGPENIGGRHE